MSILWMGFETLPLFVISHGDPSGYVVRRFELEPGAELRLTDARRVPTLDAARAFVPDHCVRMSRLADDDPGVIEVWA